MSQPGPEATAEVRRQARKPIPKPVPAYLPTAGSPLKVDAATYEAIQSADRVLIEEFTIPIRSGRAWDVPEGCIVRITTPEGPQVTGLDDRGRYFMNPSPAQKGDALEFLAEQHLLMALSTCPGGDLSAWGFGSDSEQEMIKCCRTLHVQVYRLKDEGLLQQVGWKPSTVSAYKGMHGVFSPTGEPEQRE
ncbi:hypothetical protein LLEC1_03001 [Akanthomyces lecanii]|uniref:Uncharacterized protein n=1 Tax=Cordyceps confragosa TaxID=2714763 RepID=A0A179I907_CORDF|nr:hypothetical protein LLEC1_03001 [Akanthomyces lecanii]